ncbi:MAG: hypothetical protein ACPGJV_10890 [Bacteriovoracaceae bacterium]
MFKSFMILCALVITSCATSKKSNEEQVVFDEFTTLNLRSFNIASSDTSWVACDKDYLKNDLGISGRDAERKLSELLGQPLSEGLQANCATYKCSKEECLNAGDYLVFLESATFLVKRLKRLQFSQTLPKEIFNIELETDNCFNKSIINSCALLSAHYKFRTYNQSAFTRSRTKECELLGISQRSCNFDL